MKGRTVLVLALTVLASTTLLQAGMPRGQKHESRHEIDHLEDAWRDAVLHANATALAALLDEDYIAVTARGMLLTKEQTLARLSNGRAHYMALELSDRKVRFYGGTALVTSLALVSGTNADGEDISGSFRYTRVYVRNAQGAWKIVSFEASRIHDPGERK
jgi:ketosteroid isomerase-like protein